MFSFSGPRQLKVAGLLDADEAYMGTDARYLKGVHVVVGTPQHVLESMTGQVGRQEGDGAGAVASGTPAPVSSQLVSPLLRAVCVDEVDLCLQEQGDALRIILAAIRGLDRKPQVAFIGATVGDGFAAEAEQEGLLRDPVTVRVGNSALPSALRHRYMVVEEGRKLAAVARLLRQELRSQDSDRPPARVMLFARSEEEAQRVTSPLRAALWNQHRISVLLPSGMEPIKALQVNRPHDASAHRLTLADQVTLGPRSRSGTTKRRCCWQHPPRLGGWTCQLSATCTRWTPRRTPSSTSTGRGGREGSGQPCRASSPPSSTPIRRQGCCRLPRAWASS